MIMRTSHLITLLLSLSLLYSLVLPAQAMVSETDSGIFYSVSNGVVTIEGFNAAGSVMDIPAEIEGMPVRYVADQACRGNTILTEVRLPDTLISVGEFAFAACPNLTKVTFTGGETIEFSAFRDCGALLSLSLPDTIKVIDDEAFYGCTMLGKIKIPASLTTIGVDAFMGCDRIQWDVGENSYAKIYAEQYHIPTGFTSTFTFTLILLALTTALLGGGTWVGYRMILRHRSETKR